MNKEAVLEAVKEFLRYSVFAVLGLGLTMATDYVGKLELSSEIMLMATFLLTNVGRFLDKYKYISSKTALTKKEVAAAVSAKGLLPF